MVHMRGSILNKIVALSFGLTALAVGAVFPEQRKVEKDPVDTLIREIKSGKVQLEFEPNHGYLRDLLKRLDIPWSSQILAFSKTSMQGTHISPRKPRAIYFNDQVYVGWVNGGDLLEISSIDAEEGNHFYTLPNTKQREVSFEKNPMECIACHGQRSDRSVPSLIIRSVYPDDEGYPLFTSGGRFTTPSVPLKDRWGGWYVSGSHGKDRHMGNVIAKGENRENALDMEAGANLMDLRKLFDSNEYLTPHSDIMALMIAEHQMEFQNRVGRAQVVVKAMGESATKERVGNLATGLLESLMGADEIELTDPIKGSSNFANDYLEAGVKDKRGRSLSELDFTKRMFKYRLSPMIYSPAFEGLPKVVKEAIYDRLRLFLTNKEIPQNYRFLSEQDRKTLVEILTDTKPDFKL